LFEKAVPARPGISTYKKSRNGGASIDKAVEKVLSESGEPYEVIDFFPSGSDERQFSSPGFDLPVGSLMRTPYGRFPEYHTSADNLGFISFSHLADSLEKYLKTVFILENDATFVNLNPKCEPQLGKRGLYRSIGSQKSGGIDQLAMLWVLNFSDGTNSLLRLLKKSLLQSLRAPLGSAAIFPPGQIASASPRNGHNDARMCRPCD
jgi:aminopeptidase-like protein